MNLKLILALVILLTVAMMALGVKLLFRRKSGIAINSCCLATNESSCVCAVKTD